MFISLENLRKKISRLIQSTPETVRPQRLTTPPIGAIGLLSTENLLSSRGGHVNRIEELAGTTRSHFERYYLSALRRYACWAQMLPASEAHHHAHPGGLLDHGLEVAVASLSFLDHDAPRWPPADSK